MADDTVRGIIVVGIVLVWITAFGIVLFRARRRVRRGTSTSTPPLEASADADQRPRNPSGAS